LSYDVIVLAGTAATIGFFHTVLGPDHYLPFVTLSKARHWTILRTVVITVLCGLAHVMSSVVLGLIGIAFGIAVFNLETIESFRGDLAAWLLIAFGFTYFIWGLRRAFRGHPHKHFHVHENDQVPVHSHEHSGVHTHKRRSKSYGLTPWVLFAVFVFGPCEPLIPLMIYPAANGSIIDILIVIFVFGLATLGTMLGIVLVSLYGMAKIPFERFERYSHAVAGLTIFLCGGAIKFLGL
jgi:sulfite exporter TauE/SafE